jgi:hypothetical protein
MPRDPQSCVVFGMHAADIAKLEAEIPNAWTMVEPAGHLTRALRTPDR